MGNSGKVVGIRREKMTQTPMKNKREDFSVAQRAPQSKKKRSPFPTLRFGCMFPFRGAGHHKIIFLSTANDRFSVFSPLFSFFPWPHIDQSTLHLSTLKAAEKHTHNWLTESLSSPTHLRNVRARNELALILFTQKIRTDEEPATLSRSASLWRRGPTRSKTRPKKNSHRYNSTEKNVGIRAIRRPR